MTTEARASLQVRVVPRASRTALRRDAGGGLRAHLTAPPVDGAANSALVELLASELRVPKRSLEIIRGGHARTKVVAVYGCNQADLERRILDAVGVPVDKPQDRG